MELLERQLLLDQLDELVTTAASGDGVMAVIGGEAGAGKTAVMRALARQLDGTVRVLIGGCDAMSSPRPLGPLYDVASELGEPIRRLLRDPSRRAEVFGAVLDALTNDTVVLIVEDAHWADDATLDLLRYLGRRIDHTRSLFVVTYRDDEVSMQHPLRVVLGDLTTSRAVHRLTVDLLSPDAVRTMATGSGIDADDLHARTDGNAFYVTEVLASGNTSMPATVRDAVLTRSSRLSPSGRAALDAAAVIGGRIDPWLLRTVAGDHARAVDECLEIGLLQSHGVTMQFRHQLAQDAIHDAISPIKRIELHASVLDALRTRVATVADYPRLAHHAEAAGDANAVLDYAPIAGDRAAALGAHREAARQYERALKYADGLPLDRRRDLLERWFPEGFATGNLRECAVRAQELIDTCQRLGDVIGEGKWHAYLAWALVHEGMNVEADTAIERAIALLEDEPPSPTHAHVWQTQARLRMLNRDYEQSIHWAQRAIELAARLDLPQIHTGALNAMGSSRLIGVDEDLGRANLERGLEIARAQGLDAEAASLLTNLGSGHGEIYRFDHAERFLSEGLDLARERDLDGWRWYLTAWLALTRMFQGRWNEASDLAASVIRTPAADTISVIMAQIAIGRVRARRGDPEVWTALGHALELSIPTKTLQRLAPAHAALAEAAWLSGDQARTVEEARAVYDLANNYRHPWHIGELGYWRWKAGDLDRPPDGAATPYALQFAGDWRGASAAWAERDCPYEAARALTESNDADALREAFAIFDRLGARPMAAHTNHRLRELGASSIPRGARPTTRANPAHLTARELEVLTLVAGTHTNGEIAQRLYISPKTVEHHVSAILAKLDVATRQDAVRVAAEQNLLSSPNLGDR